LASSLRLALAQPAPPPDPQQPAYTPSELVNAGHRFFGSVSGAFASVIEHAVSQWGLPNGYVLGEEAGGAFFGGLRYGEGMLYTKNAGDLKVFWQGPTVGWDFGGEGARTMMLVYSLPATQGIYQRFAGIGGSAYFVGGLGMTALTANDIILVPVRDRITAGGQCRLSEIHTASDLESILTGTLPDRWPSEVPQPGFKTAYHLDRQSHSRRVRVLYAASESEIDGANGDRFESGDCSASTRRHH
jgi:hypothetical protein